MNAQDSSPNKETKETQEPQQVQHIKIKLFVHEHHDGNFTIEVLGKREICVYATDLDQGREELMLMLVDLVERSHPRLQSSFQPPDGIEHHSLEVPRTVYVSDASGRSAVPTKVSFTIQRDRKWQRLFFPRLNCHYWLSVESPLEEEAIAFLQHHQFKKMNDDNRLFVRYEKNEWIEELELEATRPHLEEFTGRFLGHELLPSPAEKKEAEEKEAEEKAKQQGKKSKKRPKTPTLKKIGLPISQQAKDKELDRAYGREKELQELFNMLQAKGGKAIVLVGPAGCGKSTILSELAYRITHPDTPEALRERPIWFADANRVIATDGWFGDWQRQCLDVVQECIDAEVIWYIGDLLHLLDAGKNVSSEQNVAMMLKPYLSNRRITVIGECSNRNFAQLELRDVGFARLFTPYRLEDPAPEQIRQILKDVSVDLKKESGLEVSKEGLDTTMELSRRFQSSQSLLGHSVSFLRRLIDDLSSGTERPNKPLGRVEVIEHFCSETGMPDFLIRDDLPLDPEAIWMSFRKRLIGQEEAIRRMTDLVAMIKSGLSDLGRPLGSFLFVGPTGVGKTEMAKCLTHFLFGREDRLIRFDMSEFIDASSVFRFLGDAKNEGKLISAVRRNPFAVLLLDEIEKAHPAVFDVLLQVLGEARLTDEAGRTADFRNVVVLMTSNLGVSTFRRQMGFGQEVALRFRDHFIAEAERFFRPEFFNRIDYIIPFMPLEEDAIRQITKREVKKFLQREGIQHRELSLQIDEEVQPWLAERGVNPRYGARPLKRVIEKQLTAPLARHLSAKRGSHGGQLRVSIEGEGEELGFQHLAQTKKQEGHNARVTLQKLLEEIGLVRYRAQRWSRSGLFRELNHKVRLFDRLSQSPNFWNDHATAEQYVKNIEAERQVLQQYKTFWEMICSIEDLAFETYYDKNTAQKETLEEELAQAEKTLEELEFQLYSQRFQHPHAATLYFLPGKGASSFLRHLLKCYLELGVERGWQVSPYASQRIADEELPHFHIPAEDPPLPEALLALEERIKRKDKRNSTLSAEQESEQEALRRADEQRLYEFKKRNSLEFRRWMWREQDRIDLSDPEMRNRRIERLLDDLFTISGEENPRALLFEGHHVACLLSNESGFHSRISGTTTEQVKVFYNDQRASRKEQLFHPVDLESKWDTRRLRSIQENKNLLIDHILNTHVYLEPRLHLLYARMMRSHLYFNTFGEQAALWLKP
ncbi:MAG: AAA family ATPase [Myxococcales bacterium]|nr:AAA family ATPase [Myxococcales bacterium]MCB9644626.1 AAA family ATPase [Myxococcales bacterium]